MAFFVVERSASDASLSIPLPESFGSREEAIAALSAATSSGRVALTGEVFIADLTAAVPVLVMQTAPAPTSQPTHVDVTSDERPPAEVAPDEPDETPESAVEPADVAAVVEEEVPGPDPVGEDAPESWEALEGIGDEPATLADALKRAATSLEDEGIVAPESIVSEDELPELSDEREAAVLEDVDTDAAASAVGESGADAPEPEEWPWANVESYEVRADADDVEPEVPALEPSEPGPEPTVSQIIASLGAPSDTPEPALRVVMRDFADEEAAEPVVEVDSLISSAPADGEDAYLPKPVILGDYADAAAPVEAEAPAVDVEADDTGIAEPVAPTPGESATEVGETGLSDVEPAVTADVVDDEPLTIVVETGYEATGELDLAGYSCQDCIYANTCPKVGQATPADCGSFQWRSE